MLFNLLQLTQGMQIELMQLLLGHFADTVNQPMQVLEKVYQFAGLPFTEKARTDAQQWLSSNGREKRAGHDYSLQTFGLSEQQMQTDYAQYRARHLQDAH